METKRWRWGDAVSKIWRFLGDAPDSRIWLHPPSATGPHNAARGRISAGSRRIASIQQPLLSAIQRARGQSQLEYPNEWGASVVNGAQAENQGVQNPGAQDLRAQNLRRLLKPRHVC